MIARYLEQLGVREKAESPSLRLEKYADPSPLCKGSEIDAVIAAYAKVRQNTSYLFMHSGAESIKVKLRGRLIVNQAGGILENSGLCLHRHLGLPYIPGSAVKGVVRHYVWEQWNASTGEDKLKLAEKIAEGFGFPTGDEPGLDNYLRRERPEKYGNKDIAYSGNVAFLGGFPEGHPELVKDVVTSHHLKYYGENEDYLKKYHGMAIDNENPNPVFFLAVESGASFVFQLLGLKPEADVAWMKKMLKQALRDNGIGAKTSAGYGWLDDGLSKEERDKLEKLAQIEAEKQAKLEEDRQKKAEEDRQRREAQRQKEEALKAQTAEKKQQVIAGGFQGMESLKWQKFRDGVDGKFKDYGGPFDAELRAQLEKVITHNERISLNDLQKAEKTLIRWFDNDTEACGRIIAAKGGQR